MDIIISCQDKTLSCGALVVPIRIGKSGFTPAARGREGDGKTPLGRYHLRFGLYRADRLPRPPAGKHEHKALVFWPLQTDDGWCDSPDDAAYNRFVRLPYPASHERLWREDGAYDLILVISHNDSPPAAGLGSAVFIHVAQSDDRKTLGCVALTPESMVWLLPRLYAGQTVTIKA